MSSWKTGRGRETNRGGRWLEEKQEPEGQEERANRARGKKAKVGVVGEGVAWRRGGWRESRGK